MRTITVLMLGGLGLLALGWSARWAPEPGGGVVLAALPPAMPVTQAGRPMGAPAPRQPAREAGPAGGGVRHPAGPFEPRPRRVAPAAPASFGAAAPLAAGQYAGRPEGSDLSD